MENKLKCDTVICTGDATASFQIKKIKPYNAARNRDATNPENVFPCVKHPTADQSDGEKHTNLKSQPNLNFRFVKVAKRGVMIIFLPWGALQLMSH